MLRRRSGGKANSSSVMEYIVPSRNDMNEINIVLYSLQGMSVFSEEGDVRVKMGFFLCEDGIFFFSEGGVGIRELQKMGFFSILSHTIP